MTSILSGLDTLKQAIAAQQFALSITQRNVANVNNPAFTRQEVLFNPSEGESVYGQSAPTLRACRDRFLDCSISRELQSLGENSVAYDALQQIDGILGGSGGANLQQAISDFYNSFSALSSAPENLALRQQVVSTASALAAEFRRLYGAIQQVQAAQDRAVMNTVDQINSITAQIAGANKKIQSGQQSDPEAEFALRDNRQQLLEQLAGLVDISYYETESGAVTVTTGQGGLLVLEDQSNRLEATRSGADPFVRLELDGKDITESLESGQLGGLIHVRDNLAASYLDALDEMAAGIISRVNAQHSEGTDLDGAPGEDFFVPFVPIVPGSNTGAARTISVAIDDPRQVAAADAGAGVGDNSNAQKLASIREEKLFAVASETINQFYARLIYDVGTDEKTASDGMSTQKTLLEHLKSQRSAASGVNLDEEAVNIIKYQKAYQASARMANVLDMLSEEIINLLGA
jgi:flagellar hook-associated protein 1 FlgK